MRGRRTDLARPEGGVVGSGGTPRAGAGARAPGFLLDAVLSALVPGLGQLRQGDLHRALALACSALGLWAAVLLSLYGPTGLRSVLTAILLALLYPLLWLPAVLDAWRGRAGSAVGAFSPDRMWYVVLSLLAVGPMALPLLWQSAVFTRRGKLIWTAVVIAIAVLVLLFVLVVGPILEAQLLELFELLAE